eukprot:CAMPEP_0117493540 /NCGR_PEP_ID=MMETSP0784-20121206/19150_1 /TAXON_ID=39447 /ORGANISM="" /LENGTH=118 /DNA_ID=CAMNT_0005288395 /DNA_START=545 /DNA_END=902 /DNA_ORIENTATION=+
MSWPAATEPASNNFNNLHASDTYSSLKSKILGSLSATSAATSGPKIRLRLSSRRMMAPLSQGIPKKVARSAAQDKGLAILRMHALATQVHLSSPKATLQAAILFHQADIHCEISAQMY